jgi:hypothetical protein
MAVPLRGRDTVRYAQGYATFVSVAPCSLIPIALITSRYRIAPMYCATMQHPRLPQTYQRPSLSQVVQVYIQQTDLTVLFFFDYGCNILQLYKQHDSQWFDFLVIKNRG